MSITPAKLTLVALELPAQQSDAVLTIHKGLLCVYLFFRAWHHLGGRGFIGQWFGKTTAIKEWKAILQQRGWINLYQGGSAFKVFLKLENERSVVTMRGIGK